MRVCVGVLLICDLCPAPHDVSWLVAEKILRAGECVQLIVFFAAIREILKREIYRLDKQSFRRNENKRQVPDVSDPEARSCEFGRFNL